MLGMGYKLGPLPYFYNKGEKIFCYQVKFSCRTFSNKYMYEIFQNSCSTRASIEGFRRNRRRISCDDTAISRAAWYRCDIGDITFTGERIYVNVVESKETSIEIWCWLGVDATCIAHLFCNAQMPCNQRQRQKIHQGDLFWNHEKYAVSPNSNFLLR